MNSKIHEVVGPEERIIKHGGNGGVSSEIEASTRKRVIFARGIQQPPLELNERYKSILDAYTQKMNERIDQNAKMAIALAEEGSRIDIEAGEPTGRGYKFWDIFVVGPIQLDIPQFKPGKIIAGGEDVFFLTTVATNPLLINGDLPSATTLMAGKSYRLRLETMNLTNVAPGPFISIARTFPVGVPAQTFLLGIKLPMPQEGRPELFEINVTADVTDNTQQPMAAFATHILDIDVDPGFPLTPPRGPHLHIEQPLRCLCYKK